MSKFVMYSPLDSWKQGDEPLAPFTYIAVGALMESNGHLLITPQLMTNSEIDDEVNSLINELEEFRKAAKKKLLVLQEKMLSK